MDWRGATAQVVAHPVVRALGRDRLEQARVNVLARDLAAWLVGAPRHELEPLARVVTALGGRPLRDARALCHGLPLLAIDAGARATAAAWPLLRDPPPRDAPDGGGGDDGESGSDEGTGDEGPVGEGEDGDGEDGGEGAGGQGDMDGSDDDGGDGSDEDGGEGSEAEEGDGAESSDDAGDGDSDRDGAAGADGDGGAGPDEGGGADPIDDPDRVAEVLAALADGASVDHDPELAALAAHLADADDPGADALEQLAPVGEIAWQGALQSERVARTLEELVPGIGWGIAPGHLHAALAMRLDALTALLEGLPQLRELVDHLGRIEASSRAAGRSEGGSESVTGVILGGEVARALPAELALLGDEDTEDLFYQRLLERRLVSLELAGGGLDGVAKPTSKGPILACIDTSGSMSGAPEAVAKALVLAVCRRAIPQGRTVHLLMFGSMGEHRELRLRRGRGGLEDLLDFLVASFDGGTDFDTPLLRALQLLEERDLEAADVLVVTDGYAAAHSDVVEAVVQARAARGLRVISVVVGGRAEGVEPFSDEVWAVDPQDVQATGLRATFRSSR